MKKIISAMFAAFIIISISTVCFASPYDTPDWYPDDIYSFSDFHAENAPHVVDNADIFTDAEETALSAKIDQLVSSYGKDFVIYTDISSYNMEVRTLAADFYQYNGYGIGDDYSGSVLFICMEPGNRQWYSAACGSARDYYTANNVNDIDDSIYDEMVDGEYYDAAVDYINCLDVLYGHKVSSGSLIGIIIGCALAGAGIASIVLFCLYKGMKKVKIATEADQYIVPGSFNIRRSRDYYLYSTVIRRKRETNSGGGGRSGFSGGFSSSGGRSFSGGGRRF